MTRAFSTIYLLKKVWTIHRRGRCYCPLVLRVCPSPKEFAVTAERPKDWPLWLGKNKTGILVLSGHSQPRVWSFPSALLEFSLRFLETWRDHLKSERTLMLSFPPFGFDSFEGKCSLQSITTLCGLGVKMGHRSEQEKWLDAAWDHRPPFSRVAVYYSGEKYGILHSAWQNAVCFTPFFAPFLSYA